MTGKRPTLFALALATPLLGCADTPVASDTVRWDLVVERGADQEGPAATLLPEALLVQVLHNSQVVSGAFVTVQVTGGDATVWIPGRNAVAGLGAQLTERTGRDGRAEFFLGVGTRVGTYAFGVTANGPVTGDSVKTVLAFAIAGPAEAAVPGGNNQSGPVSMRLAADLSLTVTDGFGNPTPQVRVRWLVTSGAGFTADSVSITDAAGQTTNQWNLGAVRGTQTVEATIDTLPPIVFTATAN